MIKLVNSCIMTTFRQFLSEKTDFESATNEIKFEDIGSVKDSYLKTCLEFIFRRFDQNKGSISKDIISIRIPERPSSIPDNEYFIRIYPKATFNREQRNRLAEEILDQFSDGPIILKELSEDDHYRFLHHTSENTFLDTCNPEYIKNIKASIKFFKNFTASASPSQRNYGFSLYEMPKDQFDLLFLSGMSEAKRGRKPIGRFDLKRICSIRFQVKQGQDFENPKAVYIKNAKNIFEGLKSENLTGIGIRTTSGLLISRFRSQRQIEKFGNLIERSLEKFLIGKGVKMGDLAEFPDFVIYSALFSSILDPDGTGEDFRMDKLKNHKLDLNGNETTFISVIQESAGYGAVISEFIVPLVLLLGFRSIDNHPILKDLNEDDEIDSIEWPDSATNGLSDYDVIFANSRNGRRFAISAKFENGNTPTLFSLVELYADNGGMFDNQKLNQLAFVIMKDRGHRGTRTRELFDFAEIMDCRMGLKASYDQLDKNEPIWNPSEEDLKEFDHELENLRLGSSMKEKIKNGLPWTIPVAFERKISQRLNESPELLIEIYRMVFGMYGENVSFEQIELDRNLKFKYIHRGEDVTERNVSRKISIENLCNAQSRKIKQDRSLGVKLH